MSLRKLMLTQRFALMMVCVFTGFVIYGFWSFRTLDQLKVNGPLYEQIVQGKDIVADVLPPPEYIIESYLVALQLVTEDEHQHSHLIERFRSLNKDYLERHRFWLQQSLPSELRTALLETSFEPATRFYELGFNTLIPALKTGQRDTALAALSTMKLAYDEHRRAIDNVVRQANTRVASDETRAREAIGSAIAILLSVLVVSAGLTVLLAFLLTRSLTSPLFAMRNKLGIVSANKDFRVRLDASFDDEVGQMAAMLNDIIADLQAILRQISGNAATLSDTAITLSASSTQILSSTGDQSDAAASMVGEITQLNIRIQNLSDNARRALSLSQESGRLSNSGGDIIENAANTMLMIAQTVQQTSGSLEALGNQSQQISSVVKVIQDVADQTNLLALNAAIEAARAGEQGRGFAVVADEVRNLAKRTTRATEEISQMIDAMQTSARVAIEEIAAAVDKANGGAEIAQKAGEAINQIKAGSAMVVNVVNDISKSLDLQAKTTDSIHDHVSRVARMAAENAAGIERTARSAVELANLSAQMKQTASTFNV